MELTVQATSANHAPHQPASQPGTLALDYWPNAAAFLSTTATEPSSRQRRRRETMMVANQPTNNHLGFCEFAIWFWQSTN